MSPNDTDEGRDFLAEIVQDAESGTPSTILRNGKPVAVIVGYDEFVQARQFIGSHNEEL